MSKRQLEQLRETLDSIVADLRSREQAVGEEHTQLQTRVAELGLRESQVQTVEDVLSLRRITEADLTAKIDKLVTALEERTHSQPPMLAEMVSEMERIDARTLATLTERLSTSLQTAISVQLAPLSDDLPERLTAIVQSALPSTSPPGNSFALPDLMRELEKFQTRSMASLAARMTAGLQAVMATQLTELSDELPRKIATAIGATAANVVTTSALPAHNSTNDSKAAELAEELQRVKATLAQTEALLVEALDQGSRSTTDAPDSIDVVRKLASAEAQCARLNDELVKTREELAEAAFGSCSVQQELDSQLVEALRSEVADLRSLLAAKEHDALLVQELKDEISVLRAASCAQGASCDSVTAAQDEVLREQLERAAHQIIELRTKNEDLTEQVAQLQVSTAPHGPMPHLGQEGLSWEERKRLLLQQLDSEDFKEDSPQAHAKRIEVEEILRTTEAELTRRDREIAELRSLLQQQADARQGMAVGAAAVAQLIESDELVQQEREKLRAIQRTWDEKLRQAEIELSMERAKLARERLHLEEQKQQLEQEVHSATAATQSEPNSKTADARSRKWLSRLGLKDET